MFAFEKLNFKHQFQLFEGLNYLHSQLLVIHRDIKPGNLLIEEDHNYVPNLSIADFGLAVVQRGPSSSAERSGVVRKIAQQFPNPGVSLDLSSVEDCWKYVDDLQQRTRRLVGTKAYRAPEIVSLVIILSSSLFFFTIFCA